MGQAMPRPCCSSAHRGSVRLPASRAQRALASRQQRTAADALPNQDAALSGGSHLWQVFGQQGWGCSSGRGGQAVECCWAGQLATCDLHHSQAALEKATASLACRSPQPQPDLSCGGNCTAMLLPLCMPALWPPVRPGRLAAAAAALAAKAVPGARSVCLCT